MGAHAKQCGIDALYAVGRLSALTVDSFGEGARLFASKTDLIDALQNKLDSHTRVLVKGSRSAGMEEVVAGLIDSAAANNEGKTH